MNRKMTFFAFAGKCGFRGASGSAGFGAAAAEGPGRWARPIAPRLMPHCPRNQRRAIKVESCTVHSLVIVSSASWRQVSRLADSRRQVRKLAATRGSLPGDRLVKVQQEPG